MNYIMETSLGGEDKLTELAEPHTEGEDNISVGISTPKSKEDYK